MLIETESLRVFLSHADFTSETVLEEFWQRKGSILLLISELKFKRVRWIDLPHTEYAVISYQWKTKWGSIAKFIFGENGSGSVPISVAGSGLPEPVGRQPHGHDPQVG